MASGRMMPEPEPRPPERNGGGNGGGRRAPGPRLFQGRPVVTRFWNGRMVNVVAGLWAYRQRHEEESEEDSVDYGLSVGDMEPAMRRDSVLGIGVLSLSLDLDVGASLTEDAQDPVPALVRERLGLANGWVEPVMLDLGSTPDDPLLARQWGLDRIRAAYRWDRWNGDPSRVLLAVLDTGIAMRAGKLSHPDLTGERFHIGDDLIHHGANPVDDHGHGTHVAGIAAATSNNNEGIAGLWPGPVLVIKTLDAQNQGSSVTFKDAVLGAVRAARGLNARLVINYCAGGDMNNAKRDSVEHAQREGALIVAAVGNGAGGPIQWPAAYAVDHDNVIAVGAVDATNRRPDFASRGVEMSVVAPGVEVLSTLPDYDVTVGEAGVTPYGELSGTSQATPYVSALSALLWAQSPDLTASEVRQKILQSAEALPGPAVDIDFGRGIINVERTLT